MKSDESVCNQLNVVMLGSPQKNILFEKLCQAAVKYERHVHYQDVYYLTVDCDGKEELLEFTDPGLARTGGREMAIKRADLALLFYSSLSLSSLHNLQALEEDLKMKTNMPLHLVCDSDEIVEDEEDGGSTAISSVSEGYESDTERNERIRRRNSMDKIQKAHEVNGMAIEQGQKWANELGADCEFIMLSSSQFTDAKTFLEKIVNTILLHRKKRTRTIIKQLMSNDRSSPRKSNSKSYDIEDKSKICVVM